MGTLAACGRAATAQDRGSVAAAASVAASPDAAGTMPARDAAAVREPGADALPAIATDKDAPTAETGAAPAGAASSPPSSLAVVEGADEPGGTAAHIGAVPRQGVATRARLAAADGDTARAPSCTFGRRRTAARLRPLPVTESPVAAAAVLTKAAAAVGATASSCSSRSPSPAARAGGARGGRRPRRLPDRS